MHAYSLRWMRRTLQISDRSAKIYDASHAGKRPNCERPLRFAASGCWASVELSSTSEPQIQCDDGRGDDELDNSRGHQRSEAGESEETQDAQRLRSATSLSELGISWLAGWF